ncbi:MAG: sodium:proton exchanger [Polaribacter sp.]|nr:sodium:proton exchanger [Polaribacter sp.]
MGGLDTYQLILVFASIIIVSYFFNSFSKKSGIPAVLMLIGLGVVINLVVGGWDEKFKPHLKLLGTVGLILIVLEAALDLKLLKEKIGIIIKSLLVSIIGLGGTSYIAALFLSFVVSGCSLTQGLLITIPLSILSSAIILPSISSLKEKKREFMIYESTFSDIVGIISFYGVLGFVGSSDPENILPATFRDLFFTIIISIVISYVLIYIFQKLKGHAKLFLLISVLLVLYSLGKMMHLSSLIIILIFGLVLNNYRVFFKGVLRDFVLEDRVEKILDDFRLVTVESAFVVRTFFFILFGWSIVFSDLLDFKVVGIGMVLLIIIYLVRALVLFVFNGTYKLEKITPEVFLAPRGLITILLFYSIPIEHIPDIGLFRGVLLFVILFSCLIMTWSLIKEKKKLELKEVVGEEEIDSENMEEECVEEN